MIEEVFQSGIVPGDTDYRIYRDYGGIPGVDMLELSGDYVYHTALDDYNHVAQGQVQHMFDNVGAIVQLFASDPLLASRNGIEGSAIVYYDILGLGVLVYTHETAMLLHLAAAFLSVLALYRDRSKLSLQSIIAAWALNFASAVVGLAAPVALAFGLALSGNSLRWLSILPLTPVLFGATSLAATLSTHRLGRGRVSEAAVAHTGTLFWTLLLLALTVLRVGSAYVLLHLLVWPSVVRLLPDLSSIRRNAALVAIALASVLPLQYCVLLCDFFVPLMGRSGTEVPPDVVIAAACGIFGVIMADLTAPLLHAQASSSRSHSRVAITAFCLAVLALVVTLCTFPYTPNRPKRLYVQHVLRTFQNGTQDEGLWVNCMDARCFRDLQPSIPELTVAPHPVGDGLFEDMPWFFPIAEAINDGLYLPVPAAESIREDEASQLAFTVTSTVTGNSTRRLKVRGQGPAHMAMVIGAAPGAVVSHWPWTKKPPAMRADCNCHWVHHAGPPGSSWDFELDVTGDALLNLAFYGQYVELSSPSLERLKQKLPPWVSPVVFRSIWYNWRG